MAFMKKAVKEETATKEFDVTTIEETPEELQKAFQEQSKLPVEIQIERQEVLEPIKERTRDGKPVVPSCLRKEKINVSFYYRKNNKITDPKHVLHGGMHDKCSKIFTAPTNKSGGYMNVLTNDEKTYLEEVLDLGEGALSVYKKTDNFWDSYNVSIGKQGKLLDLSDPNDYIAYAVLRANTAIIAPSLDDVSKKATYIFYFTSEAMESERSLKHVTTKQRAYMYFGKIEDKIDDLKYVLQVMTGKVLSKQTRTDQIKAWVGEQVELNSAMFLKVIDDKHYHTKKLVYRGVEYGAIRKQGDFYFYMNSNGTMTPMCEKGDEPTYANAVVFLDSPMNQHLRLKVESKIDELKE